MDSEGVVESGRQCSEHVVSIHTSRATRQGEERDYHHSSVASGQCSNLPMTVGQYMACSVGSLISSSGFCRSEKQSFSSIEKV